MTDEANPCPVARLAREIVRIDAAHTRAGEDGNRELAWHLHEHMMAVEEAATHERATSSEGAFYQALILANAVAVLEDFKTKREPAAFRRLQRLASSLTMFIEGSVVPATAAALRSRFFSPVAPEELIAQLERSRTAA
jgi:hypothetical protein